MIAGRVEAANRENEPLGRDVASMIANARTAQLLWGATPIKERLRTLRKFRHALAESGEDLASMVPCELPGSLHRSVADTLVSEVLPLAEACRFLEREAAGILAPRRPGNSSRPFWLRGVVTEIHREPLGLVLIIGPSNYPLFLPGAQALQALAAGNAVLWKPAPGGSAAARATRLLLVAAGIDASLVHILDESPSTATSAIHNGVDKVFLTGSEASGRAVMRELAETLTPSVMELSGCDAVFVLEGADLNKAVEALVFGLRFNGSATCMAPRRIFATRAVVNTLVALLSDALDSIGPTPISASTHENLLNLLADAEAKGARFHRNGLNGFRNETTGDFEVRSTLVVNATPEMSITQADIFAPVLSVIDVVDDEDALAAYRRCPYALTAAVFGPLIPARRLAARIPAGSVLINDIIVATADPRASFGGRKRSGFGATRGREGLLEMTTPKTIQARSTPNVRAYQQTTSDHLPLFSSYLRASHGGAWRSRIKGVSEFLRVATKLR